VTEEGEGKGKGGCLRSSSGGGAATAAESSPAALPLPTAYGYREAWQRAEDEQLVQSQRWGRRRPRVYAPEGLMYKSKLLLRITYGNII
jgi:hypothetical protein